MPEPDTWSNYTESNKVLEFIPLKDSSDISPLLGCYTVVSSSLGLLFRTPTEDLARRCAFCPPKNASLASASLPAAARLARQEHPHEPEVQRWALAALGELLRCEPLGRAEREAESGVATDLRHAEFGGPVVSIRLAPWATLQ